MRAFVVDADILIVLPVKSSVRFVAVAVVHRVPTEGDIRSIVFPPAPVFIIDLTFEFEELTVPPIKFLDLKLNIPDVTNRDEPDDVIKSSPSCTVPPMVLITNVLFQLFPAEVNTAVPLRFSKV